MKTVILLIILFYYNLQSEQKKKYIFICGVKYNLHKAKVYLKDDDLDLEIYQIASLKNKTVFGYYGNAIRNDSLFIKGDLKIKKDSIFATSKYYYGIRHSFDSMCNIFLCKKNKIILYKNSTFLKGKVVDTFLLNKKLN